MEAEFLGHEELKLEAEVHVVVDLLQPAVLPVVGPEGLSAQLALHELLDFDEAKPLLRLLELVLDVTVDLERAELLLNASPVGLDLGVQEGVLDLPPLLVVQARLYGHHLDPALELLRGGGEEGHVVAEGGEAAQVGRVAVAGVAVEQHCEDLQVVGGEEVGAEVVSVLADGDAGLVEDHEEFLEAVVVGEQLRAGADDAELLAALLLHLKGEHLRAQLEVALRLHPYKLAPALLPHHVPLVVETDPSPAALRLQIVEGGAGELGGRGHLAEPPGALGGVPAGFNFGHLRDLFL